MPDGTGLDTLYNFIGSDGSYPDGTLFFDGNFLYGMTAGDGHSYNGSIFKIKTDGTGFVNLFNFNGAGNGSTPG